MTDGFGGRAWTFDEVGRLTNPQLAILASEGDDPRRQSPATPDAFDEVLRKAAEQTGVQLDG